MDGLDVFETARFITYLDPHPDATKRLDKWGCQWASQKIHCEYWFTEQGQGIGKAGADVAPNHSSRLTYNRIQNTGMLVWLADAFGADESLITESVLQTMGIRLMKSCSTAFRKVIPFDTLLELIRHPQSWRYDPAMMEFLVFGEDGYVDESKSDMFHVFKTMDAEWCK